MVVLFLPSQLGRFVSKILCSRAILSRSGSAMDAAPQAVMMRQRLNPLTGESEWEVVSEEDGCGWSCVVGIPELASTTYLDMLNDVLRNAAYRKAIQKVVPGCRHVLDIGAGTGLLSMMALRAMQARQGCSDKVPLRITACESFLPMLRLARKVLLANGMNLGVNLVHKRSDEMQVGIDMPSRADVLVSEILDSELLGEGLIPTLRHAHAHLLAPRVRTVPFRAVTWGQLVECDFLWRCHDLRGVEDELGDGLCLAGASTCFRRKHELRIDALSSNLGLISDPFELFTFEFSKMPNDHGHIELEVPAIKSGRVQALVSWWVLQLDEDGSSTYSTAPNWINVLQAESPRWQEHWKQCVWFLQGWGLHVSEKDKLKVQAVHDDISVRYHVRRNVELDKEALDDQDDVCRSAKPSGWLLMSPERVGMLGDEHLRSLVMAAVAKVGQSRSFSRCLIVDDSLLMTAAAAVGFANSGVQITAMLPGLKNHRLDLIHDILVANGIEADGVSVLGKTAYALSLEDLACQRVDLLLAEPYYWNYEDMLSWRSLRFWSERTFLDPFLADSFTIMPCKALLRGMAVHLPDLWQSRCSLRSVEGFDHSSVNLSLGASGELVDPFEGPLLPYALWQCGRLEELTQVFTLMTFDITNKMEECKGDVKVLISKSGVCHAVVLWLDWVYDEESELVYSTGPRGKEPTYWKQGVKLLKKPVAVCCSMLSMQGDGAQRLHVTGAFDPLSGNVQVDAHFM